MKDNRQITWWTEVMASWTDSFFLFLTLSYLTLTPRMPPKLSSIGWKSTAYQEYTPKIEAFHPNTLEYSFSDDAEVLSKRSCTVHVSEKFTYILWSYFHYIFKRLWISTNMHLSFEYIISAYIFLAPNCKSKDVYVIY